MNLVLTGWMTLGVLFCLAMGLLGQDRARSSQAHYERGLELLRQNRLEEAKSELLEVVRVFPRSAEIQNLLGTIYDRLGQADEAIQHYLVAIKLDPKRAASYNNLGIAYLRKNQVDRALEAFRQALQADPENVSSHTNLGLIYLRSGKLEEAISHLEKARRKEPGDLGILFNLATAHLEAGNVRACLNTFEGVSLEGPMAQVPEIQTMLGTALARAGRLDEAVLRLETSIRLRPEEPDAYYKLGLVYGKKGAWEKSKEALEKALSLRPSPLSEYFLALGEAYAKLGMREKAVSSLQKLIAEKEDSGLLHFALGSVLLGAGLYGQAASELEQVVQKNPASNQAVLHLAMALSKAGESRGALERLRILEGRPSFRKTSLYYMVQANVLAQRGRWVPALEALRNASELEPDKPEHYFQMGLILLNAGAIREAVNLLTRVAEVHPNSATIKVGQAQAYLAGDQLGLAEKCLYEAISLNPDYDEPHFLLGNCYQDGNRYKEAVQSYEKAVALNPDRGDFRFGLGMALIRLGEWEKALQQFQKSLGLTSSAETLYRIASIYHDRSDYSQMGQYLHRAIALDPNHAPSHYLLARLYLKLGEKSRAAEEKELFVRLKAKEQQTNAKSESAGLKPVDYYVAFLKK